MKINAKDPVKHILVGRSRLIALEIGSWLLFNGLLSTITSVFSGPYLLWNGIGFTVSAMALLLNTPSESNLSSVSRLTASSFLLFLLSLAATGIAAYEQEIDLDLYL